MFGSEQGFGMGESEMLGRVPAEVVEDLTEGVELDRGIIIESQVPTQSSEEEVSTWPAPDENTGKIPEADLQDWDKDK